MRDRHRAGYSIGQLAGLAGLPVKTIRFYADEGLLPPATRTEAGHRRFSEADVARLQFIRALRDLDVDLPTIGRVLEGAGDLDRLLQAHVATLETRIRQLRRQLAVLRAATASPSEDTIRRVAALSRLGAAERRALLESFWDRTLEGMPIEPAIAARFRDMGTPELPDDPTPEQLDAWLELAELVADPDFAATTRANATWLTPTGDVADMREVARANVAIGREAGELVERGVAPDSPEAQALASRLVGLYASALGRAGEPGIGQWLAAEMARRTDPRAARYWQLVATVRGETGREMPPAAKAALWLAEAVAAGAADSRRTTRAGGSPNAPRPSRRPAAGARRPRTA